MALRVKILTQHFDHLDFVSVAENCLLVEFWCLSADWTRSFHAAALTFVAGLGFAESNGLFTEESSCPIWAHVQKCSRTSGEQCRTKSVLRHRVECL